MEKNSDPGWKKVGSGMEKIQIRDGKKSDPGWEKFRSGMEKTSKKVGSGMETSRIRNTGWIFIRQDEERLEKKRRGEVLEGEEEAVITALDMEDAWKKEVRILLQFCRLYCSVEDPNPDPDRSDLYFFGPPGSGSFYHQAKIVRKTMIPSVW